MTFDYYRQYMKKNMTIFFSFKVYSENARSWNRSLVRNRTKFDRFRGTVLSAYDYEIQKI
jgi:hypothetical protein